MKKRDEVLEETFGEWRVTETSSSKQTDNSSCGVFALMVIGLAISLAKICQISKIYSVNQQIQTMAHASILSAQADTR